MGGPRLEVVKFGFYVFFPVGVMLYFGGPEFYDNYVKGIKFWPSIDTTYKPPSTSEEVKAALDQMKKDREDRWRKAFEEKKLQQQQQQQQDKE